MVTARSARAGHRAAANASGDHRWAIASATVTTTAAAAQAQPGPRAHSTPTSAAASASTTQRDAALTGPCRA
jgi:hypothetical protein